MSAGVFAGTNRIPTPERANGTGPGAISWPYCLAGDKLGWDAREVKLQGFVIPLDASETQRRFLLSAVPVDCPFCLPAGPDALVEVETRVPVRYSLNPIVVSGRFTVLEDDPGGVLYRLTDAVSLGAADTSPAARQ